MPKLYSQPMKMMTFKIPPPLHAKMVAASVADGMSVSEYLRTIIRDAVKVRGEGKQ